MQSELVQYAFNQSIYGLTPPDKVLLKLRIRLGNDMPETINFKKLTIIALLIIIVLLLYSSRYLLKQGWHIASYMLAARSNNELLKSKSTPTKTREFIELVNEIRNFAFSEIGLIENSNYTSYVKMDRNYLHYLLTACKSDSFSARRWSYPIFGSFPYRAYFSKEDAEQEAASLKKNGYDVYIRKVRAFSSLGILSDPLFSYMEDYSPYNLASLIIHEQTHATVFIKNKIRFNEELATFTGHEGAKLFLSKKYGTKSKLFLAAERSNRSSEKFYAFFRKLYADLDSLYASEIDRNNKLSQKKKIINDGKSLFTRDIASEAPGYRRFIEYDWNNAFILSFIHYGKDLAKFERLHQACGGSLKKTLDVLKGIKSNSSDPEADLKRFTEEITRNSHQIR